MRWAEFRGSPDPARTNHKNNLGQNQIAQPKWFFECDAMFFNAALCAIELCGHR
jgi:hypothetical protein